MNELALFAGAGGGILGGKLLGWRCVCAVEIEPYCRQIVLNRQNEGHLRPFPIWDDVCTFDGDTWRGKVEVVSGGFPCQDISTAGKGAGIDGERSGLWGEMARIIGEVRPRFAFVENSPALTSRGLHRVLGDLSEMGYDCKWGVVSATDVGAPHLRKRIWILAHANSQRFSEPDGWAVTRASGADVPDTNSARREEQRVTVADGTPHEAIERSCRWPAEPALGRVVNGVANRVDRLKALGNGQVPRVVAAAWKLLAEGVEDGA